MNIEIANRLVNLRKSNGLSQEALAEKLGISRQAVSKWERAEASPDTDNLIMLARLYHVSLDELLQTEDEIPVPEYGESGGTAGMSPVELRKDRLEGTRDDGMEEVASRDDGMEGAPLRDDGMEGASLRDTGIKGAAPRDAENGQGRGEDGEYVNVGFEGVHVKDKDGSEVHVGWDGIHVDDRKAGNHVQIDKNGVYVNGKKYDEEWFDGYIRRFPFALCIIVLFLVIGPVFNAWHPGWMLMLLIPLWYSFLEAVKRRNPHVFAYPVLAVLLYLCVGFFFHAWHPGWVIFLTVPLYYPIVSSLTGKGDGN